MKLSVLFEHFQRSVKLFKGAVFWCVTPRSVRELYRRLFIYLPNAGYPEEYGISRQVLSCLFNDAMKPGLYIIEW
jgi:hypothetical protein